MNVIEDNSHCDDMVVGGSETYKDTEIEEDEADGPMLVGQSYLDESITPMVTPMKAELIERT